MIGVAKDVKQGGVDGKTGTEIYTLVDQTALMAAAVAVAPPTMNVVLRTTLPAATLRTSIEGVLREADPSVRSCACATWKVCSRNRSGARGCWRSWLRRSPVGHPHGAPRGRSQRRAERGLNAAHGGCYATDRCAHGSLRGRLMLWQQALRMTRSTPRPRRNLVSCGPSTLADRSCRSDDLVGFERG